MITDSVYYNHRKAKKQKEMEIIKMTVVLRDEFTGSKITVLKVKRLLEENNSIKVYYEESDGRIGMTSYAFATVISVDSFEC